MPTGPANFTYPRVGLRVEQHAEGPTRSWAQDTELVVRPGVGAGVELTVTIRTNFVTPAPGAPVLVGVAGLQSAATLLFNGADADALIDALVKARDTKG